MQVAVSLMFLVNTALIRNGTKGYPDMALNSTPGFGEGTVVDYGNYWREDFPGITDAQWNQVRNFTSQGQKCLYDFWTSTPLDELHCNASWDGWSCWPESPANTTVAVLCPMALNGVKVTYSGSERAYRFCNASGQWHDGDRSDYNVCIDALARLTNLYEPNVTDAWEAYQDAMLLVNIYFFGALVSALLLGVTFFIFSYFKALQCNRISIHKNLVVSFIVRYVIVMVINEPFITQMPFSYRNVDWLCKVLSALLQYSTIANIFWMFVEGLFLHNRVAISVFSTDAPFKLFYMVGWGAPGLIIVVWSLCMHFTNLNKCWNNYYEMPFMWIIITPIILALLINAVFLINIIRILITKLRANNTMETDQFRKAVKATVVLFPLLGLSNLLFVIKPYGQRSEAAYRICNAVLQSSQGLFVSVIYCFMNSEVRLAIRKKWHRRQARRFGNARGRRRSSRTSSMYLSSNAEVVSRPAGVQTAKFQPWTSKKLSLSVAAENRKCSEKMPEVRIFLNSKEADPTLEDPSETTPFHPDNGNTGINL